ncbi:hypothetical protein HanPI659440_Chr15g0595261 [Helianthus annuus]|nr:hypothetical protein HanPI659440_Chr15g0595261 [Helianthus annuus]
MMAVVVEIDGSGGGDRGGDGWWLLCWKDTERNEVEEEVGCSVVGPIKDYCFNKSFRVNCNFTS